MQHVFIDVEAYGPPGIGRPFALGAVKFNRERGIYKRFQQRIAWPGPEPLCAHQETIGWLVQQEKRVLDQTRHGEPFAKVWEEFSVFVFTDPERPTFWADDFADFAWLDYETRRHMLRPLRQMGAQYDSSALTQLARVDVSDPTYLSNQAKWYGCVADFVQHVAVDDATFGVLDFFAACKKLRVDLELLS
jgi:hypothetical protein